MICNQHLLSRFVRMGYLLGLVMASSLGWAHGIHPVGNYRPKPILADLNMLKYANIPVTYADPQNNLGVAYMTPEMEPKIVALAHRLRKCGGFESLEGSFGFIEDAKSIFQGISYQKRINFQYQQIRFRQLKVEPRPQVTAALEQLRIENLQSWVQWLSSFPSRFNRLNDPNKHVVALVDRLKQLIAAGRLPAQVEVIDHQSTGQKSVKVTVPGSTRAQEVVVMGGHLDSISGWGGADKAPGADDNASGSANLLETLRVVLDQPQPQRTLEFYWYAGEESGLLGSAEIAKKAKAEKKNVVAVLQLDMTLFPGEGEFKIGSMTDYTSAWLRDYLIAINDAYLKIKILEGQCGYGCSDHASWFRQGYPAIMPFEARLDSMNANIHTTRDVVSNALNFKHSLVFSKIALIMAMDLANSDLKQPFR